MKGKVVYDLDAQEVGEISNIRHDGKTQVYNVLTRHANLEISFPADQFYTDESGRYHLMPRWFYLVRLSCSKTLELKKRYRELNILIDAITDETYLKAITIITKGAIKCGEQINQHLPKFEEYLLTLKKQKRKVVNETSRLMTLRLLEFGTQAGDSTSLTKKEYSLKIIDLRKEYADVCGLIRYISEAYKNAKTSISFLKELSEGVVTRDKAHPSITPEILDLVERVHSVYSKGKEMTKILDGLVETIHAV